MTADATGRGGDAAQVADVLTRLVEISDDELLVTDQERAFLAGAAAALRVLDDSENAAGPDHRDGRGQR